MENSSKNDRKPAGDAKPGLRRAGPNLWVLLLIVGVMAFALLTLQGPPKSVIQYSFFLEQVEQGNVVQVQLGEQEATGIFEKEPVEPSHYDRDGNLVASEGKKLNKHFRVVLPRDSESRGTLTALLDEQESDVRERTTQQRVADVLHAGVAGPAWRCSPSSGSPIAAPAIR